MKLTTLKHGITARHRILLHRIISMKWEMNRSNSMDLVNFKQSSVVVNCSPFNRSLMFICLKCGKSYLIQNVLTHRAHCYKELCFVVFNRPRNRTFIGHVSAVSNKRRQEHDKISFSSIHALICVWHSTNVVCVRGACVYRYMRICLCGTEQWGGTNIQTNLIWRYVTHINGITRTALML